MEADYCPYNLPMGSDGRLNPGEVAEFRLSVRNRSTTVDYHSVSGTVEAITTAVEPRSAVLDFGAVPAGQSADHIGDPLELNIPLSLQCGDTIQFRITFSSLETGDLPSEIINVHVDGDATDCFCTPVDLFYEYHVVESDLCPYTSPPGDDGRVNPGEAVDLRIGVRNGSETEDLTMVSGIVEALTPGVTPVTAVLDFGAIPADRVGEHLGAPLTVNVPATVACGDELLFLITLSSAETGELPLQLMTVPVDGDPVECNCDESLLPHVLRGTVEVFVPGWQMSSFPLSPANDNETEPFPAASPIPGTVVDDIEEDAAMVLYRVFLSGDVPAEGTLLKAVKAPAQNTVTLEFY
jgi:hypothetical protein